MSPSFSTALAAPLSIVALVLLGSCKVTDVSDEEQSASLKPYSDHKIEGSAIEDYFSGRTAILIGADGLEINEEKEESSSGSSETRDISVRVKLDSGERMEVGTAAAIDARGYFVTAGHCLDGREIYALYTNKNKEVVIEKAHPVWVRASSLSEIDFALFRVDGDPFGTFKWAGSFKSEEAVFSAGTTVNVNRDEDPPFHFKTDSFAGVLKKSREVKFEKTKFQLIWHRSPVRRGNSGGPFVNEKGELLGVNYAATGSIRRAAGAEVTPTGLAIRPDQEWIRNLIEEDWAGREQLKSHP
ncbi:MAG: serine protease [Verrucomicrobiales bacterium]|nr:serine protease [Verrucomicrobiales bacterium]